MVDHVPSRSDIPEPYRWDLTPIYASNKEWEGALASLRASLDQIGPYRGHLGDGPAVLAEWLDLQQRLERELGRVYVYAHSQHSVDTRDDGANDRYARAQGLLAEVMAALSFVEPELLETGIATLREWVTAYPDLAMYDHYVAVLEETAAHVRSPEVEELLGLVSEPFFRATATHNILADADLDFEPARSDDGSAEYLVTQGTIHALLTHRDREVRRSAWESYAAAHLAHQHTMANCMAVGVKQDVLMARARQYDSSLEWALGRTQIPVEVYHNVIDTFRASLPIWHRYWRLRREIMGHPLAEYDDHAPLTPDPPVVPLQQAAEWICGGVAPLGDEYAQAVRRGLLRDRWVDLMPNKNKTSGAFSSGAPGTPPLILMSYTDDIASLSTLAHELGHSMHSWYAWKTQPQVYGEYGIFVAEVASNVSQALVRAHVLEQRSDRAFQLAVLDEAMANYYRYFFIMPTLARFELEIHERVEAGRSLTAETLNALMADLFADAYGGEVDMDRDRVGIIWAEFHTHLYAHFYVYQYTTGIAAAQALAERILAGSSDARESYLEFLRTGGRGFPVDVLCAAGVDLTEPDPIEKAFEHMASLIDRIESLTVPA